LQKSNAFICSLQSQDLEAAMIRNVILNGGIIQEQADPIGRELSLFIG
jgi:hypothetical protein